MKKFSNFKKYGIMFLVLAFGLFIANSSYAAEKRGYVEFGKLFGEYSKTKEADKALADAQKEKQAQRDKMVEEIKRMKDELVLLSKDGEERIKKQSEIDKKLAELQAFDENARKELASIRDEKVKVIFDELNQAIQKYAEDNKYDFIFSDRALIYKNEKYNITDEVLATLDKK